MDRELKPNVWDNRSSGATKASLSKPTPDRALSGIGGWLIVFAVILLLRLAFFGFLALALFLNGITHFAWPFAQLVVVFAFLAYLIWLLIVMVAFFRKSRHAPRLVVATFWIDTLSALGIGYWGEDAFASAMAAMFVALVVHAYFDKSLRVERTFIR